MKGYVLPWVFAWNLAENDGDLASIPELVVVAGHSHATEGCTTEVEVGMPS